MLKRVVDGLHRRTDPDRLQKLGLTRRCAIIGELRTSGIGQQETVNFVI